MSLIPVQFRETNSATPQTYMRNSFELSPSSLAIHFLQSIQFADRGVDGNGFDVAYFVNDLEIHVRKRSQASGLFGSICVYMNAQTFVRKSPEEFEDSPLPGAFAQSINFPTS